MAGPALSSGAATPTIADTYALGGLRGAAAREDPAALREAARQFESLFTHMMLKSMRAASLGEGIFDSKQGEFHRDLFDQQLSLELSKGKGLGIAEMLVRQLGGDAPALKPGPLAPPRRVDGGAAAGVATAGGEADSSSPESFVSRLLPHARRAARVLGLEPQLLLAQAALETGWGKRLIATATGRDSNNMFGIKATGGWEGDRARVSTLEYSGGVAERRHENFRAYETLEQGFADYVELLRHSPRYAAALGKGGDAAGFAAALQAGGYATDPHYAAKIEAIATGSTLSDALDNIKFSADRPTD
ncbi:MAG: glucosaminidase domain-containing protein [Pseudomonadota bacterium]